MQLSAGQYKTKSKSTIGLLFFEDGAENSRGGQQKAYLPSFGDIVEVCVGITIERRPRFLHRRKNKSEQYPKPLWVHAQS